MQQEERRDILLLAWSVVWFDEKRAITDRQTQPQTRTHLCDADWSVKEDVFGLEVCVGDHVSMQDCSATSASEVE